MTFIAFSLGSNIGDKVGKIRSALDALNAHPAITITKASSFYETPPWGVTDQDWFVNICAIGETGLEPHELLEFTQSIESNLGRTKTIRWGPRIIDIDILVYGEKAIDVPDLTIPHKSIKERAFVLVPLNEIAPDLQLDGDTINTWTDRVEKDAAQVKLAAHERWTPVSK